MSLQWIDWTIMGIYFVFVLGIGFLLRRSVRTSTDFFLSGRSLPAWVTGLAFISANLGAQEVLGMGAMGAKYGCPDTTVWAIDGDGCFQMTNQELATCAINDIPIKVAIINNESLGMVRQWQTLFYNERYSNTDLHSKRIPDFVKLADAYGCVGLACDSPDDVDATITKAMEINDVPVVVDFRVHRDAMVWPMVAAGTSNDDIKVAREMAPDWEGDDL